MSYQEWNNLLAYSRDGQGWAGMVQGWCRGDTGVKAGMYRDAIVKHVNNSVNIKATDITI